MRTFSLSQGTAQTRPSRAGEASRARWQFALNTGKYLWSAYLCYYSRRHHQPRGRHACAPCLAALQGNWLLHVSQRMPKGLVPLHAFLVFHPTNETRTPQSSSTDRGRGRTSTIVSIARILYAHVICFRSILRRARPARYVLWGFQIIIIIIFFFPVNVKFQMLVPAKIVPVPIQATN